MDDYPSLWGQLVHCAGKDLAIEAMEGTLAQGEISEERLAALQNALQREAHHNARSRHARRAEPGGNESTN